MNTYPETGTLINKLGIKDQDKLNDAEYMLTRQKVLYIQQYPLKEYKVMNFDALKATHRELFGQVYEWAGKIREENISKGNSLFAKSQFIEGVGKEIFDKLSRDNFLKDLPMDQFVQKAAYYYSEINALHPFREGNGRTQNLFFTELARQAGHTLDWTRITKEDYLRSVEESFFKGEGPLKKMFDQITVKMEKHQSLSVADIKAPAGLKLERYESQLGNIREYDKKMGQKGKENSRDGGVGQSLERGGLSKDGIER